MVAVALTVFAVGCSGAQLPVTPKPMPANVTYSGKWYSPQYEQMELTQKGSEVEGTFAYRTGGTLKGTLDGHVLLFDWVQPGNMTEARREVTGKGYFTISDDGEKLDGEWGYGAERVGGGKWTASRISERIGPAFDPDDTVFGGGD